MLADVLHNSYSPFLGSFHSRAAPRTRRAVCRKADPCGDSSHLEITPLIDAIKQRADRQEYAFHVPGHKVQRLTRRVILCAARNA